MTLLKENKHVLWNVLEAIYRINNDEFYQFMDLELKASKQSEEIEDIHKFL